MCLPWIQPGMAIRGNVTATDLEIFTREKIGVIRPCDIAGGTHEQDDENDTYCRTFLAHPKEIRVRDCERHVNHVGETGQLGHKPDDRHGLAQQLLGRS